MKKRLTKSSSDKVIDGVCGGIAEYFGVDSTIIRILWALAVFLGGTGVIAYIICMIVIPSEDKFTDEEGEVIKTEEGTEEKKDSDNPDRGREILGIGLIIIGVYFILNRFIPVIRIDRFWPVILIGVGLYFLLRKSE